MKNPFSKKILFAFLLLGTMVSSPVFAFDSYRYLHVTIDTPWSIFLFLLIGVFSPFVLMAVLIWRYSTKHKSNDLVGKNPHGLDENK